MIACLDLEGVLVPEIWIEFSKKTGIESLSLTTRDIPNYDELMTRRLKILSEHDLKLQDIQETIAKITPLPGALDFLNWLRSEFQVLILSDTFYQFAKPLMEQLGWPTLFCHNLEMNAEGRIVHYRLRLQDQKRQAVLKLKELNFTVIAAGDSYNDTSMLGAADAGILYRPPQNVIEEFPQFPVTRSYEELKTAFEQAARRLRA